MSRIVLSIGIISAVFLGAWNASSAFFSDTETSQANTFTAGAVDLQVGNTSYYNGQASPNTTWTLKDLTDEVFFQFLDVKPGDTGEDTIGIKVHDNDAWACANISITKNDDNGSNEPELADGDVPDNESDDFDGELAQHLYFALWNDDGDNVLETGETVITQGTASAILSDITWPIADSEINTVGEPQGEPLTGGQTYYIGKSWCFGEMTLNPVLQDGVGNVRTPIGPDGSGVLCDGSGVNNIPQTDILMGDISFYAVQSRNNPDFVCGDDETPPPPIACESAYGNSVVSANQGTKKDGSAITDPNRTDPAKTLGVADNQFFSLGKNGNMTLSFASAISNILGYDMTIDFFEITNGRDTYPEEKALVEVSQDGITFVPVVPRASSEPGGDGIVNIDFSLTGLPAIQYVRLTDDTNFAPQANDADGYDVDAIRGNCTAIPE